MVLMIDGPLQNIFMQSWLLTVVLPIMFDNHSYDTV
jgi:hypothetical protein